MNTTPTISDPADRPDGHTSLSNLSAADQRALAALLDENEPLPIVLRSLQQYEQFEHAGRAYTAIARAPRRLAVLGACIVCGFPTLADGSPGPLLKRLPRYCSRHRPKTRRRPGRRPRKTIDVAHELTRQRQVPGKFSPTDFIVRGGHGYVVIGCRERWSDRAGKYYELVELVGLCAECGDPFTLTQTPARLDNAYQVRRCPKHRNGTRASRPWKWTQDKYREAWRVAR